MFIGHLLLSYFILQIIFASLLTKSSKLFAKLWFVVIYMYMKNISNDKINSHALLAKSPLVLQYETKEARILQQTCLG